MRRALIAVVLGLFVLAVVAACWLFAIPASAATPPVSSPSLGEQLAENGRVLATLDDWRAIMFVLVAVIVIQAAFIVWDRVTTSKRQERFADAMDKLADACDKLTVEVTVMSRLVRPRNDA